MAKIPVSSLIARFKRMSDENWAYDQKAEEGIVDCSGAFVWAYKQEGRSIYHGSNRIARTEVVKLIPINQIQVVPGMAAFKHRTPDEPGYALPSSYKSGGSHYNGDLNDYYHIGLVSENPKQIYNAQSKATGFVSSDISKGWTHVAYLSQVDYEGNTSTNTPSLNESSINASSKSAKVVAKSGESVKMRKTPSKNETVWWPVPVGDIVEVRGGESSGWYPIRYSGKNGYMMAEYLDWDVYESPEDPVRYDDTEKRWSVTIVDLNWDEVNVLLEEYPGRSFPGESNG